MPPEIRTTDDVLRYLGNGARDDLYVAHALLGGGVAPQLAGTIVFDVAKLCQGLALALHTGRLPEIVDMTGERADELVKALVGLMDERFEKAGENSIEVKRLAQMVEHALARKHVSKHRGESTIAA